MNEHPEQAESPEGAAVFPLIPPELGIHPLLMATLHAYVFLEGSDPEILHPDAAVEAMEYLATYMQRLEGKDLQRVREDMETLVGYAKEQKWPREQVDFLKSFLKETGAGESSTDQS